LYNTRSFPEACGTAPSFRKSENFFRATGSLVAHTAPQKRAYTRQAVHVTMLEAKMLVSVLPLQYSFRLREIKPARHGELKFAAAR
jgi:hypothetical protein